ncbi:MAG TPA: hypothetical protein VHL98_19635 [Microvirga sp.]|jgi:hypothetical protein|nr:hypothetical protein [Microvirga sp.]
MRAAVAPAAILVALVAGAAPAGATATLSCEVDDKAVKLDVQASVAHGMGEALSGFRGEIGVRLKGAPADFGTLVLEPEHLTHSWINGREVRLRLYRERGEGAHGAVELVLETRAAGGDTSFVGRYVLTVDHLRPGASEVATLKAQGRATCSLG